MLKQRHPGLAPIVDDGGWQSRVPLITPPPLLSPLSQGKPTHLDFANTPQEYGLTSRSMLAPDAEL